LLCWLKNSKDWTASLRERTMKSELWEGKFRALKKISGSQQHRHQNSAKNSAFSSLNTNQAMQNQKRTGKRFKSCWMKINNLAMKLTTPKKTCDSQLPKLVNSTMNWKSHATKIKPFKSVFSKLVLMPGEELMTLKASWDFWPKNSKDSMALLKRRTMRSGPSAGKFKKLKKT
jgi:hypothetical protein